MFFFFFSSRRRHTRSLCDWSSDVCSSDLNRNQISAGIPQVREITVSKTSRNGHRGKLLKAAATQTFISKKPECTVLPVIDLRNKQRSSNRSSELVHSKRVLLFVAINDRVLKVAGIHGTVAQKCKEA